MKYSIRRRLVKNFMIVIIITVLILELSLINGIKNYYYKNIESLLSNQLEFSINYLSRYLEFNSLEDIVMEDIDLFWNNTTAQIQVFNSRGELLLDSLGMLVKNTPKDVDQALKQGRAVSVGESENYRGEVMSISMVIGEGDSIEGILRFTSSMDETNEAIKYLTILLLIVGIAVILISGIVSVFLANSIVRPLTEVTSVAEKIADGQLDVRSKVELDDEIGKLSDTINYMADEIIKKEEIKNEFISSISHELKTPLTSIKGWAVTLQYENLEDNEILEEGLGIIEKESDRLSYMLEDLLDFSSFASGEISLRKQKVSMREILNSSYRQLYPRGELNGIELGLEMSDDLDEIIADKDRIKQVLINLIDNSFKFSSEGDRVLIKSYLEDDMAIIEVIDEGAGIDPVDLPNIKDKFYKGSSNNSHTGIGLSISDEIIRLHSGELEISSRLGEGTRVRVSLPLGDCI